MSTSDARLSWGRAHAGPHRLLPMPSRHQPMPACEEGVTMLPYGNGRSYGDSNLNPGGALILAGQLDRFIHFDAATGVLRCEAGVLLSTILQLVVPQGWFLPVTPGTQHVTVGGAIANDVHGKNHHVAGAFGNHVLQFELLRSDGGRFICSRAERPDWFAATVGGMGLTGLITWAEIQLRRVANPYVDSETIRYDNLEAFFELSRESERDFEYTVSWIDCGFAGKRLGRGLFNRANHAPALMDASQIVSALPTSAKERALRVPFTPPLSMVNNLSVKAFNTLNFNKAPRKPVRAWQHYRPFFYPLDALHEWNRMYGPKGFYQYQCVIPPDRAQAATRELIETIVASGMGSFLAVLKQFGSPPSVGMLSFPREGTTLAIDFTNVGPRLHALFSRLDRIVMEAGGTLYPAKDGRMGGAIFKAGYPRWHEFQSYIDPRFQSGFWRRVMETT